MPLWPVQLPSWDGTNFEAIKPLEVLVELDQPLTFTFKDKNGTSFLSHLLSEGDDRLRFLVAPTNDHIVDQLKSGARSIRAALEQPIVWIIDVDASGFARNAWVGQFAEIPSRVVPAPDVMLYPHLTPMLRLRAMGPLIAPGSLPARVVRSIVGGAENAVRWLTNYASGRADPGRPPEAHRSMYQLQAQQFAFGSFEVSFRPVDPQSGYLIQEDNAVRVVHEVERLLGLGLNWVTTGELQSQEPSERQAIFEAIKELAPAQGSEIESIEVSGRVVNNITSERPRLTRTTRRLAGEAIADIRKGKATPDYVVRAGRVGAVDVDHRQLTVRSAKEPDIVFRFEEDFLDGVLDALNSQTNVGTIAARFDGELWLVSLKSLDDAPSIEHQA